MQLQAEEGWAPFLFTKKGPRPAFRCRLRKKPAEPVRFVTVVAPYEGTVPPAIKVKVIGKAKAGSAKLQVKVVSDDAKRRIGYQIPERAAPK